MPCLLPAAQMHITQGLKDIKAELHRWEFEMECESSSLTPIYLLKKIKKNSRIKHTRIQNRRRLWHPAKLLEAMDSQAENRLDDLQNCLWSHL